MTRMTPRERFARLARIGGGPRAVARLLSGARPTVVAFVDGQRARLIPSGAAGPGKEIVLEHEVEGRHRQGGWALLNQSRYRRHIEAHRAQHFEAVATALADLVERRGIERIVLAGEKRATAAFARHLPRALSDLVAGRIAGTWHEGATTLLARASAFQAGVDPMLASRVRGA